MTDARPFRLILLALLVAVVASLSFAPTASAKDKPCAERVVDDWWGNGRVDNLYDLHCYRDAIRSLPVDVKDYSNAEEDILRALAFRKKGKPDPGPAGSPGSETTPDETTEEPGDGTTGPGNPTDPGDPGDGSVAAPGVDTSGPSSVPIPLLILGGLALLLLAAGGAGYLSRRAQARRNGGPPNAA